MEIWKIKKIFYELLKMFFNIFCKVFFEFIFNLKKDKVIIFEKVEE